MRCAGQECSGAARRGLIQRSAFLANGRAASEDVVRRPDADVCAASVIAANQFEDNSDIGLIFGYGVQSRIEENVVRQRAQAAFAGLMLDNFNTDDLAVRGDFRGAVVANNVIDCGPQLCVFGIQVGPHPWYPSNNIVGGELHDNAVRGAKIGINVDGAGVWRAPRRSSPTAWTRRRQARTSWSARSRLRPSG